MPSIRASALLLLVAAVGCDGLLGPSDDPATIELVADRTAFDWVGETARVEAEVRNEDGDLLGSPSVTWSSGDSLVVTVADDGTVTGRANGEAWVTGRSGGVADSVRFTVDSPVPCLPTGTLAVPDTVSEELVPGECGPEERYTEVWQVEIDRSGVVTFDLVSPDFNTFFALLNGQGELVGADNNGGLGFNSRLMVDVPAGTYYALVMPYAVGVGGAYDLSVIRGAHPTPCPPSGTVAFPDTVTGTTSTGACGFDGFLIDVWRLELADTADVTFQLVGDGVAMHLAVTDTLGRFLFNGSDGPAQGSWAERRLAPGAYDLWVGANEEGVTDSYTLEVMQGPASLACPTLGSVAINGTANGALSGDDCYVWYAPSEGWDLDVTDTTDVTMAVTTPDPIHPALLVGDSAGTLVGVGFQDIDRYARLDTTLVPGRYRVWVQSADLDPGDYQLSVVEAGAMGGCEPGNVAVMDSTFEEALSTTDCALIDGRYADGWTLQIDSTTRATIDLASDKFDAFLVVVDSAGDAVGRDDDSGDETDASITLDFEPGTYTLWTTSYAARSIGGYHLTLSTATASLLAGGDGGWGKTAGAWPPTRTGQDAGPALLRDRTWVGTLRARSDADGSHDPGA
jgi:hypothetical protein